MHLAGGCSGCSCGSSMAALRHHHITVSCRHGRQNFRHAQRRRAAMHTRQQRLQGRVRRPSVRWLLATTASFSCTAGRPDPAKRQPPTCCRYARGIAVAWADILSLMFFRRHYGMMAAFSPARCAPRQASTVRKRRQRRPACREQAPCLPPVPCPRGAGEASLPTTAAAALPQRMP